MRLLLYILAFAEGMTVLGFEVVVSRLLAPFFGGSLYVITAVLGVTMLALLFGYFLGGRLSDNGSTLKRILIFQIIASLLLILSPIIAKLCLQLSLQLGLIGGVLFSCFILLGPALILLGAISPQLIHFLNKTDVNAGKASGNIYAISTLGGVLAVFTIGLICIPAFGVKKSCILFGLITILPSIISLIKDRFIKQSVLSVILFLVSCGTLISFKTDQIAQGNTLLYESDGLLGKLLVKESNNGFTMLINNDILQSFVIKENHISGMPYSHVIGTLASLNLKKNRKNAVVIGVAAGSLIQELIELGYSKIFGVDIDNRTQYVAEKYFGLNPEKYTFVNDDGRHFFNTTNELFDVIILDVSSGEDQPYHLYTKEAFELYASKLIPTGIIIVNVVDLTDMNDAVVVSRVGDGMFEAGLTTLLLKNIYPSNIGPDRMEHYAQEKVIIGSKGDFTQIEEDINDLNPCCISTRFNTAIKKDLFSMSYQKTSKMFESFTDDCPEMEQLNYERTKILRTQFLHPK